MPLLPLLSVLALGQAAPAEPAQLQIQAHLYEYEGQLRVTCKGPGASLKKKDYLRTALGVDWNDLRKFNKLHEISAPTFRTLSGSPCQMQTTVGEDSYSLGFTPTLSATNNVELRTDINFVHDAVTDFSQVSDVTVPLDKPVLMWTDKTKYQILILVTVNRVSNP